MEYLYRCNLECPIHKKCFAINLRSPIKEALELWIKCKAKHNKNVPLTLTAKDTPNK